MSDIINWNRDWRFIDSIDDEWISKKEVTSNEENVIIPHTVANTPFNYFDESIYQKISGYKKVFRANDTWKDKVVLLHVGAAGHSAFVYLNGKLIGEHHNGYTAFEVNLNDELDFANDNVLTIKVDSRENQNIPLFGYVIDYMTYGGIYREVYLEIKDKCHIQDVYVTTNKREISSKVTLSKEAKDMSCIVKQELFTSEGDKVSDIDSNPQMFKSAKLWDIDNPNLYILKTSLYLDDKLVDTKETRFGFRDIEFKKDGFYLNGNKIKLRGLNRHQSYAYVGYAMPKSMQAYDAKILKNELSLNAVRTSHYPQSHHFIDACDELGLLVFTEIPGWQHIGDDKWKEQAIKNVEEMVMQYRNHPSIILWGVRINESLDDDEFYTKTNKLAHSLDNRPTSGVRYLQKSSLLEDVYAFNDFSHEGNNDGCLAKSNVTPDTNKAYFISEYNGHMYPTKAFDCEDKRVEHMLRHTRVVDAYYSHKDIAGGFGWCMFDYNTHKDFGSGDRICYHGVLDMFRNPKLAAYIYQSQTSKEDVLEISSNMDIGEHPACFMKDVYAITNADSVRLYKNDVFIKEFKKEDTPYKNMPHGPIVIDDFVGDLMMKEEGFSKKKSEEIKEILMSASKNGMNNLPFKTKLLAGKCMVFRGMKLKDAVELYNKYIGIWGGEATSFRFDAVRDGKVVKSVTKKTVSKPHLDFVVSHNELVEDTTYDVAEVRIRAVDEQNSVLPFANMPLTLSTTGPIEIIGPKVISLQGGMFGTYVKTKGVSGSAKLIIENETLGKYEIDFNIK